MYYRLYLQQTFYDIDLLCIKKEELLETSLTLYLHGPGGGLEQKHFQDHGKTNKSGRKVYLGTSQCHSPVLCFPFWWSFGLAELRHLESENIDSTSKKRLFHPEFRSAYIHQFSNAVHLNDLHAFLAGPCFCIYMQKETNWCCLQQGAFMSFRCILQMWYAKCNPFQSYFPNGLKETDVPWSWSAGEQRDAIAWCTESPGAILFLCTWSWQPLQIRWLPWFRENEFLFLVLIILFSFKCLMASQTDFWQSESCLLALSQWKDSALLWG